MSVYPITPNGTGPTFTPREAQEVSGWDDDFIFAPGVYAPFVAKQNGGDYIAKPGAVIDGDINAYVVPAIHVTAKYATIEGFEIRDAKGPGIGLYGAHYAQVLDNDIHDGNGHGIYASKTGKLLLEGNHVHHGGGPRPIAGISIHNLPDVGWSGSPSAVIKGNEVDHWTQKGPGRHTDGNGIIVDNPTGAVPKQTVVIDGNSIHHNGSDGLLLFNARAQVTDNFIFANGTDTAMNPIGQAAIEFRGSVATMAGNHLSAPPGHPVVLYADQYSGGSSYVTWVSAHDREDFGVQTNELDW
jgi:nitrous oxidase accessory protein NosD